MHRLFAPVHTPFDTRIPINLTSPLLHVFVVRGPGVNSCIFID